MAAFLSSLPADDAILASALLTSLGGMGTVALVTAIIGILVSPTERG